jgi:hypothetical protein
MDPGVRAAWIIETCDRYMALFGGCVRDLVRVFQERDYHVYDIGEGGTLIELKGRPSDHIDNHIFLPREAVRSTSVGGRMVLSRV